MKLLFVTLHSSKVGKANQDTFGLAKALVQRGHEVHIVSRNDLADGGGKPFTIDGAWVHSLAFQSAFWSFVYLPLFFFRVYRLTRALKPDIILCENNLHCPWVGVLVAKLLRRPLLILLRELTADAIYHDISRGALKRAAAFVMMRAGHALLRRVEHKAAINRGIARYCSDLYGQEIPYHWLLSYDLSKYRAALDASLPVQPPSTAIRLIYSGTLSPERGIDMVLRAMSQVEPRGSLRLMITGDGSGAQELMGLVNELNLGDSVSFLGWLSVDELDAALQSADIGLEPYQRPWPQDHTPSCKVASYVAAGIFVVAVDVPGYQEIVTHGRNGLLYQTSDELRDILQALVDSPKSLADYKAIACEDEYRSRVDIVPAVAFLEAHIHQTIEDFRRVAS